MSYRLGRRRREQRERTGRAEHALIYVTTDGRGKVIACR